MSLPQSNLLLIALPVLLSAQTSRPIPVALSAQYGDLLILTDNPEAERAIPIDSAGAVFLSLSVNSQTAELVLVDPQGGTHPPGVTDSMVTISSTSPVTLNQQPYQTYDFGLTNPAPGEWKLRIKETGTLSRPRFVALSMLSTSDLGAGFLGLLQDYPANRPLALSLVVADRHGALPTGSISSLQTTIQVAGQEPQPVTFADDGSANDANAGDGIYTASFTPERTGEYLVSAVILGKRGEDAFVRSIAGKLRVVPACATLERNFSSRRLDTNNNSRPDTLEVSFFAGIPDTGEFLVEAELTASNGARVRTSAQVGLSPGGSRLATLRFGMRELQLLGADGPYRVSEVSVSCVRPEEYILADTQFDLGQTEPFVLASADRAAVILAGASSERTVDTNNNGRFERLEFLAGVDVLTAGAYLWTATLYTSRGPIDIAEGSATLAAGRGTLTLSFDGSKIGRSAVNGPYLIRELYLSGPNGIDITIPEVGQTQPYLATRFEAQ